MTGYKYSKYHNKTFALLLIEDHEMIDNFLGIDTEGGRGTLDIMVFCHIMRHAVMIHFLFL